jgi:hypothetical protein
MARCDDQIRQIFGKRSRLAADEFDIAFKFPYPIPSEDGATNRDPSG